MIIQPMSESVSAFPAVAASNGIAPLSHLGVIRARGEDAATFLQGQLTQDVVLMKQGEARLAASLDMYIVAGTFLLAQGNGRYRNRCDVFAPQGAHLWQDKLQLTGFEKGLGVIESGDALKVIDLDGVRTGMAVCYDSEFPLPVRAQAEAGARLQELAAPVRQ